MPPVSPVAIKSTSTVSSEVDKRDDIGDDRDGNGGDGNGGIDSDDDFIGIITRAWARHSTGRFPDAIHLPAGLARLSPSQRACGVSSVEAPLVFLPFRSSKTVTPPPESPAKTKSTSVSPVSGIGDVNDAAGADDGGAGDTTANRSGCRGRTHKAIIRCA